MPPSTIEIERTPERNPGSSPVAKPRSWHTLLSQPRSLKVCKPHSRVYPHGFPVLRPRQVTRNCVSPDNIEKTSKLYVYEKERSYFEQCFKELRVLGRGLFGEALEVECLETGNRYAVKRALHTFESAGNRQLKLREATNHEAIPPHVNIVRFEKAWEERGRLYIQTELCGANLAEYRDEVGILPDGELWKVLHDMVQALHHLHSTGVLHLDVKPSNIFISDDSICKLGDFGLAFDMNQTSRDTAEEGDKYYMAPEILNDSPTTAADVYSLGVSMLELATDIDLREQSHNIRNGELAEELFESVGRDLRNMIVSLLRPDPQDRPTTTQLLNDDRLLQNVQNRVTFRRIDANRKMKHIQSGPLDKDWDFEYEDEIHPPSLRFSKPRTLLRDILRDDISDTVEGVRACLRFEDSSDEDSPGCPSEKAFRRRLSLRRRDLVGPTAKKLDFSDSSDVSVGPTPKRKRPQ